MSTGQSAPGQSVHLEVNRQKAEAMGLSFTSVSSTLSAAMGSLYVNDFPNGGHMQQVILQADASARMQLDDVLGLRVRNASGGMVPLREVVVPVWRESPQQMMRLMVSPPCVLPGGGARHLQRRRHGGDGAPGGATAARLRRGLDGTVIAGAPVGGASPLLMLLSGLVVFLVLAALYESWSIPLGDAGGAAGPARRRGSGDAARHAQRRLLQGGHDHHHRPVGQNAILIVEFARQLHGEGRSLLDAAVTAARLRLRPILMTSLAFTLGVVPLMLASGASAETQHAIGTGVFGGMISGTLLAIFFVPVFLSSSSGRKNACSAGRLAVQSNGEPIM